MAYSKHRIAIASMEKSAAGEVGAAKSILRSTPFLMAASLTGLGLGVAGAQSGYEKLKNIYDRNKSYKEMLALTPVLRQHKDPGSVKRYFNSLHRLNPHFMNDPTIAGALVYRAIESQEALGGGLGQPSTALAGMAGELAQGRSSFATALDRERHKSDPMKYLEPMVRAGFEQAENIRLENTPEQKNIKELKDLQWKADEAKREKTVSDFKTQQKSWETGHEARMQETSGVHAALRRQTLDADRGLQRLHEAIENRKAELARYPAPKMTTSPRFHHQLTLPGIMNPTSQEPEPYVSRGPRGHTGRGRT